MSKQDRMETSQTEVAVLVASEWRMSSRVVDPFATAAVRLINERHWTEADLHRLPDEYRYEIIHGRLVVRSPGTEDHQDWCDFVRRVLDTAKPAGWRVHWNIGLALGDYRLIPDLVVLHPGISRAQEGYNAITPACVVEVESPVTRAVDRVDKVDAYAAAGIGGYWRIERSGKVNIYRLGADGYGDPLVLGPGDSAELDHPYPVTVTVPAP